MARGFLTQDQRLQHADAYYQRGIAQEELHNLKEAIVDYSNAIEKRSSHVEAYTHRGWAKHQLNNYTAAISDYQKA
ncbi:MAG: hypothetical protein ACEQSE_14675, partial [Candidatus Aquirickettsiella gammari]